MKHCKPVAGSPVFRNTWITSKGEIRANLYPSETSATLSAQQNVGNKYQEIATAVWPHECSIIPPRY